MHPRQRFGAYLNGADITVHGNAGTLLGDTMSAGRIVIHGNIGDAAGWRHAGGEIYVEGNAGYRAGIHMKEYRTQARHRIGGRAGSFLGEYQAGGLIVVLALHTDGKPVTGYGPCTGMHGGKMVFRGDVSRVPFLSQVTAHAARRRIRWSLRPMCASTAAEPGAIADAMPAIPYTVVTPDKTFISRCTVSDWRKAEQQ